MPVYPEVSGLIEEKILLWCPEARILHYKRLERKAGTTFPEKETTIRF